MVEILGAFISGGIAGGMIGYGLCWVAHQPERDKAEAWDRRPLPPSPGVMSRKVLGRTVGDHGAPI